MSSRSIALACALCLSCSPSVDESESDTLVVGYSALRISLPVFVAQEQGIFREHDLDVELRRYETAQPLVEEVLDGRVLAGGFAALPIVFTAAARDESEVHLALAMIEDRDHPVSYLLRRRGDPAIASVTDLRGRRVGILPTVAYRRWLEAILRDASVDPAEVRIIPLAPPQQTAALENGGVDALFTNDPMATAVLAAGVGERLGPEAPVPAATGAPLVFGSFLMHPRLRRERPDTARRLLAALDEAAALIEADQDAARRAMTPYVRAPERPYVSRYPDARYLTSRHFGDSELGDAIHSMHELGVLEGERDVTGWTASAEIIP